MKSLSAWSILIVIFELGLEVLTQEECEPLISKKLDILCFTPLNETTVCDSSFEINSTAVFRCKDPVYWQAREPGYTKIFCKDNGEWDPPLVDDFCDRTCGRSVLIAKKGGNVSGTEHINFPWHVWVYELQNGKYELLCGGTLISSKTVVSAANCFVKDNNGKQVIQLKDPKNLKVVVGKYYEDINGFLEESAQIKKVDNIVIPPTYRPYKNHYTGDVAFITLEEKVDFSSTVLPICIEFSAVTFKGYPLVGNELAKIVSWEFNKQGTSRGKLRLVEMEVVMEGKCLEENYNRLTYLTYDKFCAVSASSEVKVCQGVNGGGLFILEETTGRHFLIGVSNQGPGNCSNEKYTFFTKLSMYKKLIERFSQDECEFAVSKKLAVDCFASSKKPILCENSMHTNARASYRCNYPIYRDGSIPKYTTIVCKNGVWDRPLLDDFCEKAKSNETKDLGFAWHAGIYELYKDNFEQICGGTLISSRVVISAAHCFHIDNFEKRTIKLKPISLLKVAFGKFYRDMKEPRDIFAQLREIERIEFPNDYDGSRSYFENDLAFIILKEKVEYSSAVLPICIDFVSKKKQIVDGAVGKIVGWGLDFRGRSSKKLKLMQAETISMNTCKEVVQLSMLAYLRRDKFCANNDLSENQILKGDNGGGLVFAKATNGKYFLRGVASLTSLEVDSGKSYAIFTDLSMYMDFVERLSLEHGFPPPNCGYRFGPSDDNLVSCSTGDECSSEICEREKNSDYGFCKPNCGRPEVAEPLIRKGKVSDPGQFPWHAGIYELTGDKYEQLCGGSLISKKVIISAAHCFTDENHTQGLAKLKEVSLYQVAVGKYYRNLMVPEEKFSEIRKISKIHIPPRYRGQGALYEGDIAVVILTEKVTYSKTIRPICIDLEETNFERSLLLRGAIGKVAGWGLTNALGDQEDSFSKELRSGNMTFFPEDECRNSLISIKQYFTIDKMCLGSGNSSTITSPGDSGGGLIFFDDTKKRYYLHGITSVGPKKEFHEPFALFTNVSSYKKFIKEHIEL